MVSIALIGDESLTFILRGLTLFTLLKFKNEIINSIRNNATYSTETEINAKYSSLIYESRTDKEWGSMY